MNRFSRLFLGLTLLGPALVSCAPDAPLKDKVPPGGRPSNVPKDAVLGSMKKVWSHTSRKGSFKVRKTWLRTGRLIAISYEDKRRQVNFSFHKTGVKSTRGQSRFTSNRPDASDAHWEPYGKWRYFDNKGQLSYVHCRSVFASELDKSDSCGRSLEKDGNGNITVEKKHPNKCEYGCGEFQPFMPPGEYYVIGSSLRVRATADTKAKQLFALKRNEKVTVVKDTRRVETHSFETAPWVQVKAKDGRTGYAFGGFLRKVGTPWFDLTK